jgi:Transposase IS4
LPKCNGLLFVFAASQPSAAATSISDAKQKRFSKSSTSSNKKQKRNEIIESSDSEMEEENFDDDELPFHDALELPEEIEEDPEFFDAEMQVMDVQDDDMHHMNPEKWEPNVLPLLPNLDFLGKTGPMHQLSPAGALPFDYFCLFIPMYMWERWASYTNSKAQMEIGNKKTKTIRFWKETSAAELKAWVASVIWFCLAVTQTMTCFWRDDYERSRMKRWFTEWRWVCLKRFFKVSPPHETAEQKADKAFKIRELWNDFIARCKSCYWPAQQLGLDEAIKKFKGRCSFKQYIKMKPVRWGLKVFAVCCSATGYLWNASIYCGKTDEEDAKAKEMGATHTTVISLMEPLAYKNHIVHMDNFYTSIPLFNHLQRLGIWACGTIRTNRKGLCPSVAIKKHEETALKKKPGFIRWASYGSLSFIAWFAKRAVHMLTNCYLPISADGSSNVQHWFTEKGEKVQKEITRPPAVQQYNLYMGAVDLYDQFRSYVQMDLRSCKFWHPLFWLVIESALVNAWLLYKVTREASNLPFQYTFFSFRKSVALALVSEWESMGCRNKRDVTTPTKSVKIKKAIRIHVQHGQDALSGDRFTSPDKHVLAMEKIPLLEGSNLSCRQMLCRQCKVSRSTFWCKKCSTVLCKGNCFLSFHTKPNENNA